MDNVIEFPTKMVRSRAEVERVIRDVLNSAKMPVEAIDTVLMDMREFLDLVNFEFPFSVSVPADAITPVGMKAIYEGLNGLSLALQRRTNGLLIERLKVEAYRAASGHGPEQDLNDRLRDFRIVDHPDDPSNE